MVDPTIFYILLFFLGLFFGSFASVIIHRLKFKEGGIMMGRSKCPKCEKTLSSIDLFPILSYLSTFGKCRYCKDKISIIYPLLEISTGILFFLVGFKLIDFNLILALNGLEIFKLVYFLFLAFITIIFTFYDILFLEINELILFIGIFLSSLVVIVQTINPDFYIISTFISSYNGIGFKDMVITILLYIFILSSLYIIILKGLKELYDVLILSFVILLIVIFKTYLFIDIYSIPVMSSILGVLLIFSFLFFQIIISKGTWMGGGDLRIAMLMGLILGNSYSFPGIMLAYISGSIIGILIIVIQKVKKIKEVTTVIPFGPFLGIGLFLTILFQKEINNFILYYL
ncbi:MAG: prepilin peptidase [Candidatus Gracilibacteria bacterium]